MPQSDKVCRICDATEPCKVLFCPLGALADVPRTQEIAQDIGSSGWTNAAKRLLDLAATLERESSARSAALSIETQDGVLTDAEKVQSYIYTLEHAAASSERAQKPVAWMCEDNFGKVMFSWGEKKGADPSNRGPWQWRPLYTEPVSAKLSHEPAAWLEVGEKSGVVGVSLERDDSSPFSWEPLYRAKSDSAGVK